MPRSAYIHVPFCRHRCGYCNFTLVAGRDDLVVAFLSALELELASTLEQPKTVDTIFVGGGTPTHLKPTELEQFLKLVTSWLALEDGAEFTVEANPSDCDPTTLEILSAAGVTRLSLGGQSFSERKLQLLERDHGGAELQDAITLASENFSQVSLDLIFGTPDETLPEWAEDLDLAISTPITHLSTYGLTIERGSAFFARVAKDQLRELPSDNQMEQYEFAIDKLQESAWDHYEVSNFAKSGARCRHNVAYWEGKFWWGFGPGAACFLPDTSASETNYVRRVNHRSTTRYLQRMQQGVSPVNEIDGLSEEQYIREKLVFGLRQIEGISLRQLEQEAKNRCHSEHSVESLFEPFLNRYLDLGFLIQEGEQLRLSRQGLLISDSLWPDLLGE